MLNGVNQGTYLLLFIDSITTLFNIVFLGSVLASNFAAHCELCAVYFILISNLAACMYYFCYPAIYYKVFFQPGNERNQCMVVKSYMKINGCWQVVGLRGNELYGLALQSAQFPL